MGTPTGPTMRLHGLRQLLYLVRYLLGARLEANSVEFWFVTQLAMLCGFVTACLADRWPIRSGVKEKM